MKRNLLKNYITKVEDKYVFNLSTIFWHFFIALISLAMVCSLFLFLWSIFPPMHKNVRKAEYPAEKPYPAPVKVTIDELLQTQKLNIQAPPPEVIIADTVQVTQGKKAEPAEDLRGRTEYMNSLNILKSLIPPAKYSWEGQGTWIYPYGVVYWEYYHQEKYRQWVVTEQGLEEKLNNSYSYSKAKTYAEKKSLLDAYITVIKPMKEELRQNSLQSLFNSLSESLSDNIAACDALAKITPKVNAGPDTWFIGKLFDFVLRNPNDGIVFTKYVGDNVDKFAVQNRPEIIGTFIESYYNFFGQDLKKFQEATDLFYPLIKQVKTDEQNQQLTHYYQIFTRKNQERDEQIAKIHADHNEQVQLIDAQFENDKMSAEYKYQNAKIKKSEWRYKALIGVVSGIVAIVLIGTILAFLSIQRSVRKIEDKLIR